MSHEVGEATEVDAEALNSENVYWIDYRKDRHFIGSELRNGRFKVNQFVHASEVSSVGLVWEGRDKKKGNMRVAIKTPKAPATPSDWPSNWSVQRPRCCVRTQHCSPTAGGRVSVTRGDVLRGLAEGRPPPRGAGVTVHTACE